MDRHQIALLRSSFIAACPVSDDLAEQFYERLFARKPSLRALFPDDIDRQRRKFMDTLVALVDDLDRPEAVRMSGLDLGRSHADYRLEEEDYALSANALIDAFRDLLGSEFGTDMEEAWRAVFAHLAGLMAGTRRATS